MVPTQVGVGRACSMIGSIGAGRTACTPRPTAPGGPGRRRRAWSTHFARRRRGRGDARGRGACLPVASGNTQHPTGQVELVGTVARRQHVLIEQDVQAPIAEPASFTPKVTQAGARLLFVRTTRRAGHVLGSMPTDPQSRRKPGVASFLAENPSASRRPSHSPPGAVSASRSPLPEPRDAAPPTPPSRRIRPPHGAGRAGNFDPVCALSSFGTT